MMNLDLAKRWLTHWEGRRDCAYDDATGARLHPGQHPQGNPTIGVGFNLNAQTAIMRIASLGRDYENVRQGIELLTDQQIDRLLDWTVADAVETARAIFPTFDYMPDNVTLVLIDLSFNLGAAKLREFVNAVSYVRLTKYALAADELRNSAWFREVGARAIADANVLDGTADPETILSA